MTRSGLPRLRCRVCHLHHKWPMRSPAAVQQFFKTALQQVCHFKVDVIAGDANAAAYKYNKKQKYPDLHGSSVAVMLGKMQREVNAGHPFGIRLRIVCSSNNHPPQLQGAHDLDCCFMAILSWRKPVGPRLVRNFGAILQLVSPKICVSKQTTKKEKQTEDNSRERGVESQRGGPAGLPRGRRRSHGGSSRL